MVNATHREFLSAFRPSEDGIVFLRSRQEWKGRITDKNVYRTYRKIKNIGCLEWMSEKETDGAFFIVNGGGADADKINYISAQWMEIDWLSFDEQWRRINAFPLPPSIIVKTRRSLHTYWLLYDGMVDKFAEVQTMIARHFRAEKKHTNLNGEMRLPFTWLSKHSGKIEPTWVTLEKFEPHLRYTQQDIVLAINPNYGEVN